MLHTKYIDNTPKLLKNTRLSRGCAFSLFRICYLIVTCKKICNRALSRFLWKLYHVFVMV